MAKDADAVIGERVRCLWCGRPFKNRHACGSHKRSGKCLGYAEMITLGLNPHATADIDKYKESNRNREVK